MMQKFLISPNHLGQDIALKIISECNNSDYWHKFTVVNIGQCEESFIIKSILDFLHPVELTPVNFMRGKRSKAFFLANNCLEAIMKLVLNDLQVPSSSGSKYFKITIVANYCPLNTTNIQLEDNIEHNINDINVQLDNNIKQAINVTSDNTIKQAIDFQLDNIKHVVEKRLNNNSIDLKEFHNDPELVQLCLLSNPNSLALVMNFVKNLMVNKIILANNSIKVLDPIELLGNRIIISIDLQGNQVTTFEDLKPLKHFTALSEINLLRNPIHENVAKVHYIIGLKKLFPKLIIIDGVPLTVINKTMSPNNFLCSNEAGDLAEQFLEYFFTVYDRDDRSEIIDLYHENAMFSTSCRIISNQQTEKTSRLSHYFAINRSLHTQYNSSKDRLLFKGRKNIMDLFKTLPRSNHDPYKIKTDVIHYSDKRAVIVVHGIFREEVQYFGFSRNFVLECDNNQQYCITNDQLHVYNALDEQVKTSFKKPQRIQFTCKPTPFLAEQYFELQKTVHSITNLNLLYCRRLLEEFHYDLKETLVNFINRHINNQIPPEAFVSHTNNQQTEKWITEPKSPDKAPQLQMNRLFEWSPPEAGTSILNLNTSPLPVGTPVSTDTGVPTGDGGDDITMSSPLPNTPLLVTPGQWIVSPPQLDPASIMIRIPRWRLRPSWAPADRRFRLTLKTPKGRLWMTIPKQPPEEKDISEIQPLGSLSLV